MKLSREILSFLFSLDFDDQQLPEHVKTLNPFKECTPAVEQVIHAFYDKFYGDAHSRTMIIGINPGRHGAGSTGLPFTDTKRLNEDCAIPFSTFSSHEPSSVFIYEVVKAYGGPEAFYKDFYITSMCPLGFVKQNKKGSWVNYNYYDDAELFQTVEHFMKDKMAEQLQWPILQKRAYCLGTGKNFKFVQKLNEQEKWFEEIIPLEHPRYVMQYKYKEREKYVTKFLKLLGQK